MNSTPNPAIGNPDAVLTARADERLAHVHEQLARADEQLARVTEQLSTMEHEAARHPSALSGPRLSRDRPALRGLVGFVLAACICAAAFALQSPYGEAVRPMIAQWAPNLISTSSSWSANPGNSAQPSPSTVRLAAVEATPSQPLPSSAPAPAQDVAPTPAPMSPELTQLLQTMAHDIATLEQGIEQLKANQEQMAADNARAIEQLKASQEQTASLVAKPPRPDTRAKTPTPSPRPVANATPKPQPSQARAHAPPVQLQPKQQ
jgi:hypothetical protein